MRDGEWSHGGKDVCEGGRWDFEEVEKAIELKRVEKIEKGGGWGETGVGNKGGRGWE